MTSLRQGLCLHLYIPNVCVCAKPLQLCLTLCDPMDCSLPGSSVRGILQEYWNGFPCPLPGALPDPGIESAYLRSLALAGKFFTTSTTWEALYPQYPGQYLAHSRNSVNVDKNNHVVYNY